LDELDGIESNLRLQLATLAPGDPQGEVDLELLRARLAEVAARREIARVAGPLARNTPVPVEPLTVLGSEPWWGQAAFLGLCGIAWIGFIASQAIHSFQTLGYLTPDQIAKYSAFWSVISAVGWVFVAHGIQQACWEELTLKGRELTIRWRIGPFHWSRQHLLEPESRTHRVNNSYQTLDVRGELTIRTARGKWLNFGMRRPVGEQLWLRDKINAYLDELPSQQELPSG
jgi:hypothetical protein